MSKQKKVTLDELENMLTQHHQLESMLEWIDTELDRMKNRKLNY